ncbi:9974_t:CDS:2, partial [Entrophospora sp. SA101]
VMAWVVPSNQPFWVMADLSLILNEGNEKYWYEPCKKYFNSLKYPPEGKNPYSARYIGSMVADVHRTLLYGGIFAYPADKKSKNGKLRILYECFPMAFLTEQAGGKAIDGKKRVLDLVPGSIHSRCPIFLGSKDDIEDVEKFYADFNKPLLKNVKFQAVDDKEYDVEESDIEDEESEE